MAAGEREASTGGGGVWYAGAGAGERLPTTAHAEPMTARPATKQAMCLQSTMVELCVEFKDDMDLV